MPIKRLEAYFTLIRLNFFVNDLQLYEYMVFKYQIKCEYHIKTTE